MLNTFINHQLKAFWRAPNKGASLGSKILLGFFLLYFFGIAVSIGVFMGDFLPEVFKGQSVLKSFNGIILFYFAFDFIMRLQLQELPTLSVIPYLHLKISKSKIISFLNIKALFSAFNIWPFLIFLPFCFTHLLSNYGWLVTLMYIVSIVSIMLFNNFIILYLKRKSISNVLYSAIGMAFIALLAILEYFKIISIMAFSDSIFQSIIKYPFLAFGFTALAILVFIVNSKYLRNNLYIEELSKKTEKKVSTQYSFLSRFGKVGELAALELKLILRHKRSRSSVFLGLFFLFYGFIFYKAKPIAQDAFGQMMFGAVFMTGITIMIYGQHMFAWQSAHFDGLLTSRINLKDFIKAKFLLFTISATAITILASFYGFLSPKLLLLQLAAYLYNIGFGTVLVLYLATFNYKGMDLGKSATFNFQGVGSTQWILSFGYILVPFAIYLPFGIFDKPYLGLLILSLFGLAMLLLRNYWVGIIVKKFEQQRYKIAEGFRA
jgi:hypothetical protein